MYFISKKLLRLNWKFIKGYKTTTIFILALKLHKLSYVCARYTWMIVIYLFLNKLLKLYINKENKIPLSNK